MGSSCCIRKGVSGESDDDDECIDVVAVRGKRGGTTATNANDDDDDGNDKLDSVIIIHINVAVFGRFRNVAGNMLLLLLLSAMMDSVGRRKSSDRKIYDRTMSAARRKGRCLTLLTLPFYVLFRLFFWDWIISYHHQVDDSIESRSSSQHGNMFGGVKVKTCRPTTWRC